MPRPITTPPQAFTPATAQQPALIVLPPPLQAPQNFLNHFAIHLEEVSLTTYSAAFSGLFATYGIKKNNVSSLYWGSVAGIFSLIKVRQLYKTPQVNRGFVAAVAAIATAVFAGTVNMMSRPENEQVFDYIFGEV